MRRLGRWAFNILAGLSLTLCAATLVFWVRSYSISEAFWWTAAERDGTFIRERHFDLSTIRGGILLSCFEEPYDLHQSSEAQYAARIRAARGFRYGFYGRPWYPDYATGNSVWQKLGFGFFGNRIILPSWFLAVVFAVLPIAWLRGSLSRWRRRRSGLCPVCSYDLRATPSRCPECGLELHHAAD